MFLAVGGEIQASACSSRELDDEIFIYHFYLREEHLNSRE